MIKTENYLNLLPREIINSIISWSTPEDVINLVYTCHALAQQVLDKQTIQSHRILKELACLENLASKNILQIFPQAHEYGQSLTAWRRQRQEFYPTLTFSNDEKCNIFALLRRLSQDILHNSKILHKHDLFFTSNEILNIPPYFLRDIVSDKIVKKETVLQLKGQVPQLAEILEKDSWRFPDEHKEFYKNASKDLAISHIRKNSAVYQHLSPDIQRDREVALAAIEEDGSLLANMQQHLKMDKEVVKTAIKGNKLLFHHADESLYSDPDLIKMATFRPSPQKSIKTTSVGHHHAINFKSARKVYALLPPAFNLDE